MEKYDKVKQLFDEKRYGDAINEFQSLSKTDIEQIEYQKKIELYLDIADCYYEENEYSVAAKYYTMALVDEDYANSSYVNFKIGECLYYEGVEGKAKLYLIKAYEIDGEQMFVSNKTLLNVIEDNI